MKIKFGAIVVDGHGKLGGHVFAQNRSGNYMRTKKTPSNPQTSYQTLARALFGQISQAWSGLTESARLAWNGAVSSWQRTDIFGDLKNPSGKALFQRLNNQAQSAGYPPVTAVPERVELPTVIMDAPVADVSTATLSLGVTGTTPDVRLMLFATPPLSQGTTFVKDKLALISTEVSDAIDDGDLFLAYTAKYGALEAGNNVYIAIKIVAPNGQASPLQVAKLLVQA